MECGIEAQGPNRVDAYDSAEFKLTQPKIFYRFKVRKSAAEPLYAVVKEGSTVLENIKAGDVISMRYYCLDKAIPAESRNTKIKYITKDGSSGFKDHYVVGLSIEKEKKEAGAA